MFHINLYITHSRENCVYANFSKEPATGSIKKNLRVRTFCTSPLKTQNLTIPSKTIESKPEEELLMLVLISVYNLEAKN